MAHEEQDYIDGWQTYSTWIDNLRNKSQVISEYDEDQAFRNKLLSCSSNLDRFKLIWTDDRLVSEIKEVYSADLARCNQKRSSRVGKSFDDSKRMRELGNKSFKDGKFMDALNHYTQAVRFAPYPSQDTKDESLALALANRSAALYSLTRYRLCLLDIDLAIKYGYPESSMFKLLIRKVKCLHILSVWANDVEQIKDNLKTMLKSRSTKEFVKVEIANMFEFIDQTMPEDMEKDELDVVDETMMKISNVSKSLTQAADCVEMSCDGNRGRYLITNKDVSLGRLLVAEEPFVCNLAPSKRDMYCYNCFARLHACGLGCTKCTQVVFCSEECLNSKMEIHAFECNSFLDLQEDIGVAYLVAHLMFKINFDLSSIPICTKKTVDRKSLEDVLKISSSDWPDLVFKNDYAAVLSLMDHSSDYGFDEMMGLTLTAAYLTDAFVHQFNASIPRLVDEQTQLVIGSVVLRHLLQLQTNLISILDQNLQGMVSVGHSLVGAEEHPIGVGIYPTVSLMNHSCNPNIFSVFHRNKFVARSSSSLECGTEITYCYGPSVSRMSRKDRRKRLKDQYFFNCDCECCTDNKENDSRALLCPDCQGALVYNQDYTSACQSCHTENKVDVKSHLKRIEGLRLLFTELRNCDIDPKQKIHNLKDIETNLSKLVHWRHPMFVEIKSDLVENAEASEDPNLALEYCLEEQALCEKTYGRDSYEAIMTKLKLLNIRWQQLYYSIEEDTSQEAKVKGIQDLKSLQLSVNETRGELRDLLASTNIFGAESSFETELKFLNDIQNSIIKYQLSLESPEQEGDVAIG